MSNSIAAEKVYLVYSEMSDEDVVLLAQDGDQCATEYLVDKYKNFVRAKARSYFLIGADREDIIQEGMIGLFKAVRDYRPVQTYFVRALLSFALPGRLLLLLKQQPGRNISL